MKSSNDKSNADILETQIYAFLGNYDKELTLEFLQQKVEEFRKLFAAIYPITVLH